MAVSRLAPSKSVRVRWTQSDAEIVKKYSDQKSVDNSLTPYGISPREGRKPKDATSGAEKKWSELVDGSEILLPLEYSNSWYPYRVTRYFDTDFVWERVPGGATGKTIGDLFDALVKLNPARYGHYDKARGSAADEARKVFEHWENTDLRWAYLHSKKATKDPLAILTEVPDPRDSSKVYKITSVAAALPRTVTAQAAPTRPAAPASAKKIVTVVTTVSLDKDSWNFRIAKDRILAVAHGKAKYEDLADGSFGKGPAADGTAVDITGLFPAWVKQALMDQVKTGAVIVQPDPLTEPTGFNAREHDLGHGNCHGFTSKIFQIFDQEAFLIWKPDGITPTSVRPEGAPQKMSDLLPRRQYVEVFIEQKAKKTEEKPMEKWGVWEDNKFTYPAYWFGWIQLGKKLFVERILGAGASNVSTPRFGDMGVAATGSKGFKDHSLIALGLAAATVGAPEPRIYTLQKMSPMNPYAIMASRVSDFDWYRFPKGVGHSKGAEK